MARALRKNIEGGWYHITARGHNRQAIFLDDGDRTHWIELLAESVERFRMEVHAYVCMDNHYHLLIRTPEANVSRAIQWLNTSYGIWWNRRHGQCGGVFQGRFKGVLVEHGAWVVEASLYLHLNPVAVATGLGQGGEIGRAAGTATGAFGGGGKGPPGGFATARLEFVSGVWRICACAGMADDGGDLAAGRRAEQISGIGGTPGARRTGRSIMVQVALGVGAGW